jgi:hypothetical protein
MSDISDSDGSEEGEYYVPMGKGYMVRLGVTELRSPEKVRQEARERSSRLLSYWHILRQVLDRYEELIRNAGSRRQTSNGLPFFCKLGPISPPSTDQIGKPCSGHDGLESRIKSNTGRTTFGLTSILRICHGIRCFSCS